MPTFWVPQITLEDSRDPNLRGLQSRVNWPNRENDKMFHYTMKMLYYNSETKAAKAVEVGGGKRKYEEVVEEERGPRVPRSQGLKDQDISKSHSNTSLTLKKVHLVG